MSIIYGIVGLLSLGYCWTSYEHYKAEKSELLSLLQNPQYQSIGKQYADIIAVKDQILKNSSKNNTSSMIQGMECHGTVKADKGIYTFHVEGSKGEHNTSSREDTNDRNSVEHHH